MDCNESIYELLPLQLFREGFSYDFRFKSIGRLTNRLLLLSCCLMLICVVCLLLRQVCRGRFVVLSTGVGLLCSKLLRVGVVLKIGRSCFTQALLPNLTGCRQRFAMGRGSGILNSNDWSVRKRLQSDARGLLYCPRQGYRGEKSSLRPARGSRIGQGNQVSIVMICIFA
jgi:hypothetical protein